MTPGQILHNLLISDKYKGLRYRAMFYAYTDESEELKQKYEDLAQELRKDLIDKAAELESGVLERLFKLEQFNGNTHPYLWHRHLDEYKNVHS